MGWGAHGGRDVSVVDPDFGVSWHIFGFVGWRGTKTVESMEKSKKISYVVLYQWRALVV